MTTSLLLLSTLIAPAQAGKAQSAWNLAKAAGTFLGKTVAEYVVVVALDQALEELSKETSGPDYNDPMHLIYDVRCSRTPVVSAIPGIDYKPFNIVDGQMDTSWQVHGRTGVISIYFHGAGSGGPATVQGIQIYGGFRSKAEWYWGNHRPARVRVSDGVRSQVLSVADNGGPLLGSLGWENVSVLHIEVLNVYSGSEWDDLAISEVVLY